MKLRFAFLLTWWLAGPLLFHTPPVTAAEAVRFTVTVARAIMRTGPGIPYAVIQTAVRGQTFAVTGRTSDGEWLRVSLPGAPGEAWIKASLGAVKGEWKSVAVINLKASGSATALPATSTPPRSPLYSTTGPTIPVVAAATGRAREIYQAGLALGNNPRAFSKVGDCQSVAPYFLAAFDSPGQYRLGDYGYLQETIDNFKGSFWRDSAAARNGMNAAGVLSPLWADAARCAKDETPLECEYRLHRPVMALISLGTNGAWQTDADYEATMRKIVEISIARGVLPILSTKADSVEGGNRFNFITAKLASEYDLPLWNFWAAASALPGFGIVDQYHLSWGRPFFDNPGSTSTGWGQRNLTALQSLDSVWRGSR